MTEEQEKTYTILEAHKYFGVNFNNLIWSLVEKDERSEVDNESMIMLAHASFLHWSLNPDCSPVNLQRGMYMIAMAYTFSHYPEGALRYAKKCLEMTQIHQELMNDFDIAYAHAAVARALALAGLKEEAKSFYDITVKLAEAIEGEENKKLFDGDFTSGPWFGLN